MEGCIEYQAGLQVKNESSITCVHTPSSFFELKYSGSMNRFAEKKKLFPEHLIPPQVSVYCSVISGLCYDTVALMCFSSKYSNN